MEENNIQRPEFLNSVARMMNAGGEAAVRAYDLTSNALGWFISAAVKVPGKTLGLATGGLDIIRPREIKQIEAQIEESRKKIEDLYFKIGRAGAGHPETEGALQNEVIKSMIAEVRENEQEIERQKIRIAEILKEKSSAPKARPQTKIEYERVVKNVQNAIKDALDQGAFETTEDKELFGKVAGDLTDHELDIKILAASELGRRRNPVAVPILIAAADFEHHGLLLEIISALVCLGDPRAVPLFKDKVNHPKHRVRLASLRGLHKMADVQDAGPITCQALEDEQPEVRSGAAMFLGWMNYHDAVPALVHSLHDKEAKVRKASLAALSRIRDEAAGLEIIDRLADKSSEVREQALSTIRVLAGEELAFDLQASGQTLAKAVQGLKDWWSREKLEKMVEEPAEVTPAPDQALLKEPLQDITVAQRSEPLMEEAYLAEPEAEPTAMAMEDESITEPPAAEAFMETTSIQEKAVAEVEPEPTAMAVETESITEPPAAEAFMKTTSVQEPAVTAAEPETIPESPAAQSEATEEEDDIAAMGQFMMEAEPDAPSTLTETSTLSEDDLRGLNKADLIALAQERGIEVDSRLTKVEIRELLTKGEK
ncbi:MAG: HEAT repeat domain-containing protein [Deltaproteobacteria bacterium]|nr:HEAT repeat domain-containing protein [Deltaproteobacteria bacterium]